MPIPPIPPAPDASAIYNFLMAKIEPDLASNQIPLLKEKYKTETPEEKEVRRKRYVAAFKEFDIQLHVYFEKYQEAIRKYKHAATHMIEEKTREKEASDLETLLSQELSTL